MVEGKNILIIEDIKETVVGTISELELRGYLVARAGCMNEAREKLKSEKYDAVLLDWWLPEEEGGDIVNNGGEIILREIRNGNIGEKNANVSVIIYTAHLDAPSFKIPDNAQNGVFSKTTGSVGIVDIVDCLFKD